jgi:hypothetical protein
VGGGCYLGGCRQQTLQNKQTQPKSRPIRGRIPDQSQCARHKRQFGYETSWLGG